MRLSTIAVCLLLVSPTSVLACWKDAPETGWFREIPSSYGDGTGASAGETMLPGWSLAGAGLASIALIAVSFRAFSRAAGRGPMQPTRLAEEVGGDRESQEFQIQDPGFQYV